VEIVDIRVAWRARRFYRQRAIHPGDQGRETGEQAPLGQWITQGFLKRFRQSGKRTTYEENN
jgi:hypothetical protein